MRNLSDKKILTAICSMANALTAGSMFTYPVFSPTLQSSLNFSIKQVSTTASISILSQYLSAPLWGFLADRKGSALVSLVAGFFFFIGYFSLSLLISFFETRSDSTASFFIWFSVTFAYSLCGSATSASYFAALTSTTQLFGSLHPGLSIAGPATLFGLSPLVFTSIGTWLFTHDDHQFDALAYLRMLAGVTLVVNLEITLSQEDERAPLMDGTTASACDDSVEANEQPIHRRNDQLRINPLPDHDTVLGFLSHSAVWMLGFIVLLTAGPAEMTIASIGSVIDSFIPLAPISLKAKHVQIISLANAVSRLIVGWTSDRLCKSDQPPGRRRIAFMAFAPTLYLLICAWIALGGQQVWILSFTTGICYATIFSMAPSIIATIWPIEDFGRNYGIISYFSATGSFLFTGFFGMMFNDHESLIHQGESVRLIYGICGLSELMGLVLMICFSKSKDAFTKSLEGERT
ncbi:major facilitator superfamily domain-containing protein [Melampsora americana]|nr:major facilitator superfamily domain-containing protein [Melampsora americana]